MQEKPPLSQPPPFPRCNPVSCLVYSPRSVNFLLYDGILLRFHFTIGFCHAIVYLGDLSMAE